jgi:serine protease AprX
VLDTGIAASGDLAGRVVASADLSGEWTFTDSYGHGTFMAGQIAGSGQGGGPAGVAPGVDLVDLKVAGADGATTLGQVLAAMQLADAARDRLNLRVLNVSLGAPADDPATAPLTEAVERLWADGITVVAASGNEGGGVDAPGLDRYVVTVGAVDPAGAVPSWSSRGPDFAGRAKPDLVAPGVGLVGLRAPGSTIDLANPEARVGDHYFRGSGTSMSTAVVAGAAALVAAAHLEWGPDWVKAALTRTAAGTLDLGAALGAATVPPADADLFPLRPAGAGGHAQGPRTAARARLAVRRGRRAPLGADGWPARADGRSCRHRRLDRPSLAERALGGRPAVDQELAQRGWGPADLAARSWAARSWAELAWEARSWAARSWASRRWTAAAWAASSWPEIG